MNVYDVNSLFLFLKNAGQTKDIETICWYILKCLQVTMYAALKVFI